MDMNGSETIGEEGCSEFEGGDLAAYKDIDLKKYLNYCCYCEAVAIRHGRWSRVNCEIRHRIFNQKQNPELTNGPQQPESLHNGVEETVPKDIEDKEVLVKQLESVYKHSSSEELVPKESVVQVETLQQSAPIVEKEQSEDETDSILPQYCTQIQFTLNDEFDITSYKCVTCSMAFTTIESAKDHIRLNAKILNTMDQEFAPSNQLLVQVENHVPELSTTENLASDTKVPTELLVDIENHSDDDNFNRGDRSPTINHLQRSADDANDMKGTSSAIDTPPSSPSKSKECEIDEDSITIYQTSATLPLPSRIDRSEDQVTIEELENRLKAKYASKKGDRKRKRKKFIKGVKNTIGYTFVMLF